MPIDVPTGTTKNNASKATGDTATEPTITTAPTRTLTAAGSGRSRSYPVRSAHVRIEERTVSSSTSGSK